MATPLIISTDDYLRHRMGTPSFSGYVWDRTGFLLYVSTTDISVESPTLSFPFEKIRTDKYTSFHQFYHQVTISLLEIANNDVLYDELGRFICPLSGDGSGKIKIAKYNLIRALASVDSSKGESIWNDKYYDLLDLKDVNLSAQAYSNIFTHIVSLMTDVDMPKYVSNQIISVEILDDKGNLVECYGIGEGKDNTFAYYNTGNRTVTATVQNSNLPNVETYSTLWNVQNVLGAHEIRGHGEKGWGRENWNHHLVYAFQMNHPSWDKTTSGYQKVRVNSFWDAVKKQESDYNKENPPGRQKNEYQFYRDGQKSRIYPPTKLVNSADSIGYLNNLIQIVREMR